ncbi:MAG: PRTRC system protein C [Candidatus Omnitrophota bacterium]|jgi:PRTRC genetic system protein C
MARRIFIYDGKELPDIDAGKTPDDIRNHYADFFPELYNAESKSEKRGEDTVITFTKRTGTKSASGEAAMIDRVVSTLREVPTKSLRLVELANSIPIKNGVMDEEELECLEPEIKLAVIEAKNYSNQTILAVAALKEVGARQENVG